MTITSHSPARLTLLQDLGDLRGAADLLREALQSRRETLGARHPDTLRSINNLTDVLRELNQLDEARAVLGDAMVVVGRAPRSAGCGPSSPS